ncbi:helix-turn-helix domain-containing protein [Pinibacter soli]|uniref:Helix-turn-helix domain-containing protein n=1 Tax=Pinibacter soli TaxID=3044211 RepID=A0ABT6RB70_9BACT|nr:helix-turn-helix domain-containing protein [Pinibacter soli]MDI3319154.1 helix-turn-helix domain-containing protein [Pinibacter soli]
MILKKEDTAWIESELQACQQRIKQRCKVDVALSINQAGEVKIIAAETIIDVVAKALNVSKIALFGRYRSKDILFARYICIDLIRQHTGLYSPSVLCKIFNRDRTTIINSIQELKAMLETKHKEFCSMYEIARQAILNETTNTNESNAE